MSNSNKPAPLNAVNNLSNAQILNAVWADASQEYQSRVPLATRDNLQATGNAILNYQVFYNEFLHSLVNKFAFMYVHNNVLRNRLGEFKRGPIPFGYSVEEVFTDITDAMAFDPELAESELYKRTIPNTSSIYHVINRQDVYRQTISRAMLQRAVYNEGGLSRLIESIVQALYNSDEVDEFIIMKSLIANYFNEGLFYPVEVDAVVDETSAKTMLTAVRSNVLYLDIPSRRFNSMGVMRTVAPEDQVLVITPAVEAAIDVNALAQAFNMSKADFTARHLVVDNFGPNTDNIVGVLFDREWFIQYDTYFGTEAVRNPMGLYDNMYLHHQGIYSTSRFANAVVFISNSASVTGITVTGAASVAAGTYTDMTAKVNGTASNYVPQSVNWSISGEASSGTYIDKGGRLFISSKEPANETGITVTATSTYDDSINGTATVKITA